MERAFVARRGGAAVASPADWQLILDWERRGMPLPVVLEGLDRAFERRLSRSPRLALRACAGAVETAYAAYRRRRAGLPVSEPPDSAAGGPAARSPRGSSVRSPARSPVRSPEMPPEERASVSAPAGCPPPAGGDGLGDGAGAPAAPGGSPRTSPSGPEPRSGTARRGVRWAADLAGWRPDPAALCPEDAAAAVSAARNRLSGLAAGPVPDEASPATDPGTADAAPDEGDDEILEEIETELLRRLARALREPLRSQAEAAAAGALARHRRRMPPDEYRQALAAAVRRRLPRLLGLPRLPLESALPETPNRAPPENQAAPEESVAAASVPPVAAGPTPAAPTPKRPRRRPSDSPAAAPSSPAPSR